MTGSTFSGSLGLFADLYELTMAAAFHAEGRDDVVTFDLFVRRLPAERDFLVVCGIEAALNRLASFSFGPGEIDYLAGLGLFGSSFLDRLRDLRFTGEVRAIDEGELAFGNEPLLTVTAPVIEAQLVETMLINTVGFETMIASKAARVTMAAQGRPWVDFSARRDHGLGAAVEVARAAYVGGADATSLVEAGRQWGIALSGTMAHSYVMAHGDERAAFRSYLRAFGAATVFLVDTYDVGQGVRNAVTVMREEGVEAKGVRIDSGDLTALSGLARSILDEAGFTDVVVLVSGDLDEDRIAELLAAGAPIDAFGVGTRLGTSADAPYLSMVYKLVDQGGEPRIKLSAGKRSLPGRKQVWRGAATDTIMLDHETGPSGARPLLRRRMAAGRRTAQPEHIEHARARCAAGLDVWLHEWAGLPPTVAVSPALDRLAANAAADVTAAVIDGATDGVADVAHRP